MILATDFLEVRTLLNPFIKGSKCLVHLLKKLNWTQLCLKQFLVGISYSFSRKKINHSPSHPSLHKHLCPSPLAHPCFWHSSSSWAASFLYIQCKLEVRPNNLSLFESVWVQDDREAWRCPILLFCWRSWGFLSSLLFVCSTRADMYTKCTNSKWYSDTFFYKDTFLYSNIATLRLWMNDQNEAKFEVP